VNDTGAALRVLGNRYFTTTADFTNRGELELGGGTFNANSIDNQAAGTITGFGTVGQRPTNAGTIRSTGGTLAFSAGIAGSGGTIEASAGSTVDLSAGGTGSSAGNLVLKNTGGLVLGNNTISVSTDYQNENAGTGNAFNARNGVTGSGAVNSSVTKTQTLTGDVTGGSTATPSLALGAVRIGVGGQNTATGSFRVNNSAGGPSLRGAVKSSGNGANLATENQFAITGGPRNFGPVAAGSQSDEFQIAFAGSTTGSVSRTVAIVNNFDNVAGQLVTVTAEAFQPALPNITPSPIALGDLRVGTPAQQAIAIANNAPVGAFSESLIAGASATGTGISITGGPSVNVAPGSSNSSIGVAINTATAGARSGSVNIARSSTGATGLADLNLGNQSIPVSASVYRLASPTVLNPQPIDFGIVHVGDTIAPVGVSIRNAAAADGFSERLDATFGGATSGILPSGSGINNLAAGSTNSTGLRVGIDTSTAQVISGTTGVNFTSDGSGINSLGQTVLASQNVAVTGVVNNFANAAFSQDSGDGVLSLAGVNSYVLDFGDVPLGAVDLSTQLRLTNLISGPADDLAGDWTLASNGFQFTGFNSFNDLSAGAFLDDFILSLDTSTLDDFSGSAVLSPRSENASGFSGTLSEITLTIEDTLFLPGDFDDDGDVDGADFLNWQRNDGTAAGLALWEDNFGASGAPLASNAASVPEPSTTILAGLALLAFGTRKTRFKNSH